MKKVFLTVIVCLTGVLFYAQNIQTKKILKDIYQKRIVAIGEDTHGTKEFHILRHFISKELVVNNKFNVIILENPADQMLQLNDDLMKTDNIDSLMQKHLFSIYQTKEMKDFLLWIREYNTNNKNKIIVKGCDDSGKIGVKILKERMEIYESNSNLQKQIAELFDKITLSYSEYCIKKGKVKDNTQAGKMKFYAEIYDWAIETEKIISLSKINDDRINELMYQIQTSYLPYKKWSEGKYISRDEIMAQRVLYYAKNKDNKLIVLAHNAHISKKDIIDNEIGLMGKKIQESLPLEYFSLALMSGTGTYSYIENKFINNDQVYDDPLLNSAFIELNKNSWNFFFFSNKKYWNKYIGMKDLVKCPNDKKKMRLVGYGKEVLDKDYYDVSKLSDLYDGIIFVKNSRNSTGI
ncbi:MAG: erythromycin esterase family protein [Flavobacterium sp.]|nr:erythromycin esterase family protein [Flavobacterium sp.]